MEQPSANKEGDFKFGKHHIHSDILTLLFKAVMKDENTSIRKTLHRCINGMRNMMLANKVFYRKFGTPMKTKNAIQQLHEILKRKQAEKKEEYAAKKIKHSTRIDIFRIAELLNTSNSAQFCAFEAYHEPSLRYKLRKRLEKYSKKNERSSFPDKFLNAFERYLEIMYPSDFRNHDWKLWPLPASTRELYHSMFVSLKFIESAPPIIKLPEDAL